MEDSSRTGKTVVTVTRLSRRSVLATMGILAVPGCIAQPGGDAPDDGPATNPTTDPPSPTPGSVTGPGITPGVNEPKADHAVYLANEGTQERTVSVEVTREATGDPVFEETLTAQPGSESEIYNLNQADPDGVEAFAICARLVSPTPDPTATAGTPAGQNRDCITLQTDACYGTAHITVLESGELQVFYSIC